ncbi:SGNH hydrolase-type esterase domain-containing protein [Mycena galericulata]|nr:SGNH hydrolase-type esterase domain-containing protein [Mycena galericulata]
MRLHPHLHSFASGPGIPPREGLGTGRSKRNYAHLLAEKLDADLTDLTVGGATLRNVLDTPQTGLFRTFAPQLDGLPAHADIVTLTAGGNDMGYIRDMMLDSLSASIFGPRDEPRIVDRPSMQEITNRFTDFIDHVRDKAPGATVYLVEYINVFGPASKPAQGTPLSQAQIDHYRRLGDELAQATRRAAEARPGTVLVPLSDLSLGHEVGSDVPWMIGFGLTMLPRGVAPYHPNAEGHVAVAEELYKRISESRDR